MTARYILVRVGSIGGEPSYQVYQLDARDGAYHAAQHIGPNDPRRFDEAYERLIAARASIGGNW